MRCLYLSFRRSFRDPLEGTAVWHSSCMHLINLKGTNITRGFERILWGFFKKMILADWAAVFADAIFEDPDKLSAGLAHSWEFSFYTIQLYADFSGGMDVVIGIASMFGIELDENFKRPFFRNFHYRFLASLAYYAGNLDEGLCVLSGYLIRLDGEIWKMGKESFWQEGLAVPFPSVWQI